MPTTVLQTLKKKCNPTLKKSFKERNPDVDMDEIQNNPNVPEDVKAAISGALTLTLEEEESVIEENQIANEAEVAPVPLEIPFEPYDEDYLMGLTDDDESQSHSKKNGRRGAGANDDEDWQTCRRKSSKSKRKKSKKKKSKKSKSKSKEQTKENEEQITNGSGADDPNKKAKSKKKHERKPTEASNTPLNSTTTSMNGSEFLNASIETTEYERSFSAERSPLSNDYSFSNGKSLDSGNESALTNGDSAKKDGKPKKTPKKRDSTERQTSSAIKRTYVRRQLMTPLKLESYMECIEAVVKGHDVSLPQETAAEENYVKVENESSKQVLQSPIDNNIKPLRLSQHKQKEKQPKKEKEKVQRTARKSKDNGVSPESKVKTKRKSSSSSTKKEKKDKLHMGVVDQSCLDKCASMTSLSTETAIKKTNSCLTAPTKLTKIAAGAATSMKKIKFIS